jgi:hypothetical protein
MTGSVGTGSREENAPKQKPKSAFHRPSARVKPPKPTIYIDSGTGRTACRNNKESQQ